jgi:phosphatidylserine/phosphatidylglycerophosphate/cardiolipin synthase-like enzyme
VGLLDIICNRIEEEKNAGNDLIGVCSYSSDLPDAAIASPRLRGSEIFPAVADMIEAAESEVLISLYKFQNDSDGAQEILSALEKLAAKASRTGKRISVKIMINQKKGPASLVSGDSRSSPIDLRRLQELASANFDIQVTQHEHHFFGSSHSKMIICDGRHAAVLTGDPTFRNARNNRENWVEIGTFCNNKAIAQGMQRQFANLWNGSNVVAFPQSPREKSLLRYRQAKKDKCPHKKIVFLGKNAINRPYTSYHSPYKIALLTLLKNARYNVRIMANNINDPDILKAILHCAARGVKVDIAVGRYHGEPTLALPGAGGTNVDSINYLLSTAKPHQLANLNVKWACDEQGFLVQAMAAGTVHGKLVIVDEIYVLTGSSPLDRQASRSAEGDMLFESTALANQYYQRAFSPIFNHARRAILPSVEKHRDHVRALLKNANGLEDIQEILRLYITVRESEKNYKLARSITTIFKSQHAFSRSNKIQDARNFLNCIEENQIAQETLLRNDGLLGEIFRKYKNIIQSQSTHRMRKLA